MKRGFEYLEHPADIIIHSWGPTKEESYIAMIEGMFQIITDTSVLGSGDMNLCYQVEAEGKDDEDGLYQLMKEFLFLFSCDDLLPLNCELQIYGHRIVCQCVGLLFDSSIHIQGTEIKAITCCDLRVEVIDGQYHCKVIVDV